MSHRSRWSLVAALLAAAAGGCKDTSAPAPAPRAAATAGDGDGAAEPVPVERDAPPVTPARDRGATDRAMRMARARPHAERVMKELDADGDGALTLAEARAGRGDRAAVLADFAAVDLDGDGALTLDEVAASLAGVRRGGAR
jgi:hypothetical protein